MLLKRAATMPLHLAVLGGASLGAALLASWPIAALGALAYGALVAVDAMKAAKAAYADADVRRAMEAIARAREEVERVAAAAPERVRRNVATALASIAELAGHGAVLAARADELSAYLAGVDVAVARRAVDEHAARAAGATDAGARADWRAAAAAAGERLAAIGDIGAARARTLAHLAKIASAIEAVPAKLVRLRALDDQAAEALTGGVGAEELERMNIELRAFETTLASIVEVGS